MEGLGAILSDGLVLSVRIVHAISERVLSRTSAMLSRTPAWLIWLVVLLFIGLPSLTRAVSTLLFHRSLSAGPGKQSAIPLVPYWVPGLAHLFPIAWDMTGFVLDTIERYGWERPLLVRAAAARLVVVARPQDVVAVFKSSRFLSTRFVLERVQRYLVGVPRGVVPFYQADDSGMAAEPRKGSRTAQGDRILYLQAHTHQRWLASPHLEPLVGRFLGALGSGADALGIGGDWVEYPDLYAFLQSAMVRANIETMLGSKVLELNPSLVEDFCAARANVPTYLQGWPRWLVPGAFRARDRVVGALEKWHAYGHAFGDYTKTGDADPDWDPVWGSKCEKVRQQYMNGMKALTAHVRACEDWGFLIGLNYNTPPTVFWYLFEALRDPGLHERLMAEVAACRGRDGTINTADLAAQPLLESAYAEVLRLRVSIVMTRTVEYEDIRVAGGGGGGGLTVPRGDVVLMPTDSVHFNEEAWSRAGRPAPPPGTRPLAEFDAGRFLVPSDDGPRFSLDGLAGLWIPYGGGDRMCPGRHLVKMEMLIVYAYLFSTFEIEATGADLDSVRPDKRYVSYGGLPPDRVVRFRIRRKV